MTATNADTSSATGWSWKSSCRLIRRPRAREQKGEGDGAYLTTVTRGLASIELGQPRTWDGVKYRLPDAPPRR